MKSTRTSAISYVAKALDAGDLDRAIEIWSLAFGFTNRDRWAMFYDSFLDTAIGAYLGDYLVSIVGIINFQMWFGDKLLPCAGVSAVASRVLHVNAFVEALDIDAPPFAVGDPLGLSESYQIRSGDRVSSAYRDGNSGSSPVASVGPGELIQFVTGFLRGKPDMVPETMYGVVGEKSNFCVEFF